MRSKLKISIVTPSYNRAGFIESAIESVKNQPGENVEHIIVDGGSTDSTLPILKEYPHLQVISDRDRGVYDALNKGIQLAKGEIVGLLNTDDCYEAGVFEMVLDVFSRYPEVDAVVGGARVFEIDPQGLERTIAAYPSIQPDELVHRVIVGIPIFNAWFFRRKLLERIGPFSLDFPIVADRDFLISCYLGGMRFLSVDPIFYNYRQHRTSLSISNDRSSQIPLRQDTLRLAEKYMRSHLSDKTIRRLTKKRHAWTSIELMVSYLRKRELINAVKVVLNAIRYNPFWPIPFIAEGLRRIRKQLGNSK